MFITHFLCDFSVGRHKRDVKMWSWDWSTALCQVKLSLNPDTGLLVELRFRSGAEKSSSRSISCWPEHLNFRVFLLILENTNRNSTPTTHPRWKQQEGVISQTLPLLFSSRQAPRVRAIIYGSTSCPVSSSQTGFTVLSYTISDLSPCSSDTLSVWPLYHLTRKESFKKSPMGVLKEEDQVATNLTSLGTWAIWWITAPL